MSYDRKASGLRWCYAHASTWIIGQTSASAWRRPRW